MGRGAEELILQWNDTDYNMTNWGVQDSSSLMICLSKSDTPRLNASSCLTDASLWKAAPLRLRKSAPLTNDHVLSVDISRIGTEQHEVLAIRYGWPLSPG